MLGIIDGAWPWQRVRQPMTDKRRPRLPSFDIPALDELIAEAATPIEISADSEDQAIHAAQSPIQPARPKKPTVDEGLPTELYHAAKPKPKAVPIAAIGGGSSARKESAKKRSLNAIHVVGIIVALLLFAVAGFGLLRQRARRQAAIAQQRKAVNASAKMENSRAHNIARATRAKAAKNRPRAALNGIARSQGTDAVLEQPNASADDPVRVKFERRRDAIVVPARIGGPDGTIDVPMVFDTGATFCSIRSDVLKRVGIFANDTHGDLQTAAGAVRRPIAVLDSLTAGEASVTGGLTVVICDECGMGDTAGLIGLNFARHFVVTIDHDAGQLLLARKQLENPQLFDITPFIRLQNAKISRENERLVIRFDLENTGTRALTNLLVIADPVTTSPEKRKSRDRMEVKIAHLAPRQRRQATILGPLPHKHRRFKLSLKQARW